MDKSVCRSWLIFGYALLTTFAVAINYKITKPGNDFDLTNGILLKLFQVMVAILNVIELNRLVCLIIFAGLLFFYMRASQTEPGGKGAVGVTIVFSVLIAILRAGSELFKTGYDLSALEDESSLLAQFVLKSIGYTGFFYALMKIMRKYLPRMIGDASGWSYKRYLVILGIGWLPHLIIRYPGAICWDAWSEINTYRTVEISEHAPVLYTVFIGGVISLFEKLGCANIGLFAIVVLQYVALVCVFAYMFVLMDRLSLNRHVRTIMLIVCLLNPYITSYIGVVMYDVPYTTMLVLFLCVLIDVLCDGQSSVTCRWKCGLLAIAVIGSWLLRKNGPYVIVPTITVLAIYAFSRKKNLRRIVVIGIASCICAVVISGGLNLIVQPEADTKSSSLSLPLQQLARVCAKYDKEISDEDKAIIDKVVNYEEMIVDYTPRISDPVKDDFRDEATDGEIADCLKVWLKLFYRHPLTCLSATWEQNYYFFMPETVNISIYQDTDTQIERGETIVISDWTVFYEPIFTEKQGLYNWKRFATAVYTFLHSVPVLNVMSSVSIYTYLLLVLLCYVIVKKQWTKLILLTPVLLIVLIAVAAPAILGHPRYVFPMIYAMPAVLVFCAWEKAPAVEDDMNQRSVGEKIIEEEQVIE
jgi:hypothetical protein